MTAHRWTRLAATLACGAALAACSGSTDGARDLVWSDEFTGATGSAPDPASWRPVSGGDGWGNEELQCYTESRSNSIVDGHG